MPTYEYKCDSCGHIFEEFQNIKDDPIDICPICNSEVHRLINGGVGLIFKGSGFYITDYKNSHSSGSSNGNGNGNGNGKKAPVEKETSVKPESKPKSDSSK